ncbi:Ppx/GppA phosphatase family protein [Methanospirillum stamsii]|uniref:Ppx/GppA family phosphatase n=1 Tax=Methanospirillum stamsii TaxID=1277351 RepID=A0A2V2NKF1_9EURY|nr:Ppx/GppA phosphatase family protein [Methanospirillum stamsii]PWR76091.1 Ppx/GppA family phosphatase [Methanospirillum stamsii]
MQLTTPRIVGFIDLGTNSVRLLIVRLDSNGSYSILTQQKEVIRLGDGEFGENRLTASAIERATDVITRLIDLAKSRGVKEFLAVATSAAREASNGEELCNLIDKLTGVRINIISGTEEARLIWLGVSSGVDLRDEKALFIDIGGGSTEIIIGDQYEPHFLRSLKLGAIRSTGTHISVEKDGRITDDSISRLRRHIDHEIVHSTRFILDSKIARAFGSSGTILSLESIAASYKPLAGRHNPGFLGTGELETLIPYLAGLPLQIRREVQGLNPERADIIVAGAVILHEILKSSGIKGIYTSSRSLRDGLLVDFISRIPNFPHAEHVSVRERSVRHLGKTCHIDEKHAGHIVSLCLMMFQSGKKSGLFSYTDDIEEIFSHAAYLHDVGQFISFPNHHQHSFYLITEVPLLGFNQHEVIIMALIARYHRKKLPRPRDSVFRDLNRSDKKMVQVLSFLLRLAENLDRSHDLRVKTAEFVQRKEHIVLKISSASDCSLELWAAESEKEGFFRIFRKPLLIEKTGDPAG